MQGIVPIKLLLGDKLPSFLKRAITFSSHITSNINHSCHNNYHFYGLLHCFCLCIMLSSCKTCWISLYKRAELFLHVNPCKRRKHLRLSAGFDLIPSSFGVMELSGQFRQVFKVIDANGDGKISSLELSEVLLCLGHEKSTASKAAEGMIREMDFNGDGYIDLDEFLHAVNTDGAICSSRSEEDCLMDAFLIFDTDKNGLISAKELRKVLISLGFSKCSLQECNRMIRGVDKDGDGFVDFKEFRSMMTAGTS